MKHTYSMSSASYPGALAIKLIHAAHANAAQTIEQHIAPGYEAGMSFTLVLVV
jgi:hypothetical protein